MPHTVFLCYLIATSIFHLNCWLAKSSANSTDGSCSVTYSQFQADLEKDLRPRLEKTGDQGLLQPFFDYFKDKNLSYLSQLLALWEGTSRFALGNLKWSNILYHVIAAFWTVVGQIVPAVYGCAMRSMSRFHSVSHFQSWSGQISPINSCSRVDLPSFNALARLRDCQKFAQTAVCLFLATEILGWHVQTVNCFM